MFTDRAVEVCSRRVGNGCDLKLREFVDGVCELWVCDCKRNFLFVFDCVQERGKHGRYFALGECCSFVQGSGCAVEFLELLELETVGSPSVTAVLFYAGS